VWTGPLGNLALGWLFCWKAEEKLLITGIILMLLTENRLFKKV